MAAVLPDHACGRMSGHCCFSCRALPSRIQRIVSPAVSATLLDCTRFLEGLHGAAWLMVTHVLQGKVEGIITIMVLAAIGSKTQESVITSPDL